MNSQIPNTGSALPTSVGRAVRLLAQYTVREALRTRIVWLMVVLIGLGLGLAEFVASVAITEADQTRAALLGACLRLAAVLVVSLFVAGSMARELADKGLALMLSLPMSRATWYAGKLTGHALVAWGVALLVGASLLIYAPPQQVAIWTFTLGCELMLVAALALLCILGFNQVPAALAAVLAIYVLARSMPAIRLIGHGPLMDPTSLANAFMRETVDAIAFMLPSLDLYAPSSWLAHHDGAFAALQPVIAQTLIYLLLLAGAGLFDLYRKSF